MKYTSLLLIGMFAFLTFSCDDDYPYEPPYGEPFEELWSEPVVMPPLCPTAIEAYSSDGQAWLHDYDGYVTVISSMDDLRYYYSPEQFYEYPEAWNLDFRRYSIVILTAYSDVGVSSYTYNYGINYAEPSTAAWFDVSFNIGGKQPPRGILYLAQAAIVVNKLPYNAPVGTYYDFY